MEGLIRKAQAGDRASFDELMAHYRPRLEALVQSRLGKRARSGFDLEDVLQEISLRALQSLDSFRWQSPEKLFGWLSGIAINVLREGWDRERRHPEQVLAQEPPAHDDSPSTDMRREERFDRLKRALDSLSPEHRQVIVMARIDRKPVKEIAKELGRSRPAVSQLLLRALEKLRGAFGATDSFHLPPRRLDDERSASHDDE